MPLHVTSTMFSLSVGQNSIIQHLLSSHSIGGRPMLALDGHLQVRWYQMLYNTIVTS